MPMKKTYLRWSIAILATIVAVLVGTLGLSPKDKPSSAPNAEPTDNSLISSATTASPTVDTPAPSKLVQMNLNQPARYAFITDSGAPQLAVFDTYDRKILPPITLKTTADHIGISRYGGYLAYAKHGDTHLHRFDLNTQQHQLFAVKQPIESLAIHFGGRWIAYTGKGGSGIMDMHKGVEMPISTSGKVSLLYPPGGDSLLVTETERGRVQRIRLADLQAQTLAETGTPISAISMMPNGMALFFVADGVLQRYSLLDDSLQSLNISAAPWRPYITADSRLVLFFSALSSGGSPELVALNAYTYAEKYRFALPNWQPPTTNHHEAIATGWLEQVAVVADNNTLYSLALSDTPNTQNHGTESPNQSIRDMLVQSDSKTLLATLNNSDQLWIFNLREQQFAAPIDLGLKQPNAVVMGETNTLCH